MRIGIWVGLCLLATTASGPQGGFGNFYNIFDDATGGDCENAGFGDWDAPTKTCAMTRSIRRGINIRSNGITLDGAGQTITGGPAQGGVDVWNKRGVIVRNLTITAGGGAGFACGILLTGGGTHTIEDTSVNAHWGICLEKTDHVVVRRSNVNGNQIGIRVIKSNQNDFEENELTLNKIGVYLNQSSSNQFENNTIVGPGTDGFRLLTGSSSNRLLRNVVQNHRRWGR